MKSAKKMTQRPRTVSAVVWQRQLLDALKLEICNFLNDPLPLRLLSFYYYYWWTLYRKNSL